MEESSNLDIVKFIVLFATMPFWGPFVKALWQELNASMRADGGLLGDTPTPVRRKQIEAEMAREDPRQVHELLAHLQTRRARSQNAEGRAPRKAAAPARPRGGPQAGAARRPFGARRGRR